jgi:hypothetical protein
MSSLWPTGGQNEQDEHGSPNQIGYLTTLHDDACMYCTVTCTGNLSISVNFDAFFFLWSRNPGITYLLPISVTGTRRDKCVGGICGCSLAWEPIGFDGPSVVSFLSTVPTLTCLTIPLAVNVTQVVEMRLVALFRIGHSYQQITGCCSLSMIRYKTVS